MLTLNGGYVIKCNIYNYIFFSNITDSFENEWAKLGKKGQK